VEEKFRVEREGKREKRRMLKRDGQQGGGQRVVMATQNTRVLI